MPAILSIVERSKQLSEYFLRSDRKSEVDLGRERQERRSTRQTVESRDQWLRDGLGRIAVGDWAEMVRGHLVTDRASLGAPRLVDQLHGVGLFTPSARRQWPRGRSAGRPSGHAHSQQQT